MRASDRRLLKELEELLALAKTGDEAALAKLRPLAKPSRSLVNKWLAARGCYNRWKPVAKATKKHFAPICKKKGSPSTAEMTAFGGKDGEFAAMVKKLGLKPDDIAALCPAATKQEPGKWLMAMLARKYRTNADDLRHVRAHLPRVLDQRGDEVARRALRQLLDSPRVRATLRKKK
jgi:hypothetical protein